MPKLDPILFSPACYTNVMIKSFFSSCIIEYISTFIALKLICYSNFTRNWTSMINLIHDFILVCDYSKLSYCVAFWVLNGITLSILFTILAFYLV